MDSPHRQHKVTFPFPEFSGDDRTELDRLVPFVYEELRRIAHRQLRRERTGHTLSTTELVHEAYAKLVDQCRIDRAERLPFFAVASTAMRRVLIEYARRRQALKRGSGRPPVTLDESVCAAATSAETLLALDEAMTRLAELDERQARVVECRYFGGLTETETADVLHVTPRTVRRDWLKAKAWLLRELQDTER